MDRQVNIWVARHREGELRYFPALYDEREGVYLMPMTDREGKLYGETYWRGSLSVMRGYTLYGSAKRRAQRFFGYSRLGRAFDSFGEDYGPRGE